MSFLLKHLIIVPYFAFIVIGAGSGILNVAWLSMQSSFGVSLDSLGILLTATMAGGLTSSFLSGKLIGRFGVGRLVLAGSLLSMGGFLAYALVESWPLLLIVAYVTYLGGGLLDGGMNTFVSARYGPRQMNWLHAFYGVGHTISPFFVTLLITDLGQSWRFGYLCAALLQLILALLILRSISGWILQQDPIHEDKPKRAAAPIRETLRLPIVQLTLLLFFLYGGVEIGAGQLANSLFVEGRGIDPRVAGTWVSIYWGVFTLGRMLMGALAERFSERTLLRWAGLGMALGAAMLWLNISETLSFVGLALLGFSAAPVFPTYISSIPVKVGLNHAPNTIGFQLGITLLGGTILPAIAGVLATSISLEVIGALLTAASVAVFIVYEVIARRMGKRTLASPIGVTP